MSTTLVLVIVLVFSFVASRRLLRLRRRLALPTAGIYALVPAQPILRQSLGPRLAEASSSVRGSGTS